MAYTILIQDVSDPSRVEKALQVRVSLSPFVASTKVSSCKILISSVRLREAKSYCGQHPGPCAVGGPKKKSRYLEWNDWVAFNNMVNDVLDQLNVKAEVWSTPAEDIDKGRRFWVRRGLKRRVRWDWTQGDSPIQRTWNHGSPDQFEVGDGLQKGS